jgi:tetratricopeptide (TPR) repeat protein
MVKKRRGEHKWLKRLGAVVLGPLVFLALVELGLRIFGYGYSTGFFETLRVNGTNYLVNNPNFSLRFFPPQLTRWPARIMVPEKKPTDTCRIFILGESAAAGDPEVAFGAGRYLEAMLSERFPTEHFQIINTAITAINSNVILPIARDCAREHGDLWIIYMGNNEMVGPFGAATVFGAQAPPLPLIRLNGAIQRTRIGQLLVAGIRKLHGNAGPSSWSGMEMFLGNKLAPDDPRKGVVYKNFESNLRDITHAGVKSGAKVLLNTVAVNLKDCPPFASVVETNGALSAESEYRKGQTLLSRVENKEAGEEFQKACDDDALPFRADSRINGLIAKVGKEYAGQGADLFDAVGALAVGSKDGICGDETFYEHVHFNFDGNYRLARAWAERIKVMLGSTIKEQTNDWASQEVCERRLALTDWNRYSTLDGVVQRMRQPPLNMQSNNTGRVRALRERMQEIRGRMTPDAEGRARGIYSDALKLATGDHFLHENFAAFLTATGDYDGAIAQWRQAHELVPQDFTVFSRIGGLLAREGKWEEAEGQFRRAVAAYPAFAPGWVGLGETHVAEGNAALGLQDYEQALKIDPRDAHTRYYIGGALSKLNRSADAAQSYREAARLEPDYWEAHFALGVELGSHDDIADARREFEEVVRLNPAYGDGHLNLAVALMQQEQWARAERELEETLRLEPGNPAAQAYLRQTRAKNQMQLQQ